MVLRLAGTGQLALRVTNGTALHRVTVPVPVMIEKVTEPVGFVPVTFAVNTNDDRYTDGLLDDVSPTAPGTITVKLPVAVGAAAKLALPACTPCSVQVPKISKVIVVPLTPDEVQTVGVVDVIVTGSPDVAVAEIVTGGEPNGTLANPPNEIVCAPTVIANVCVTCGAAEKFALPA